jgi:hypothetical protein
MNGRRLGKFIVSEKLLRDAVNTGDGANVFAGMIPLDITRDFIRGSAEYVCWHPDFRDLPHGEILPTYKAIFDTRSPFPKWIEQND